MPAPKKYHSRTYVGFNFEADRIKDFEHLCWTEHKTMSEKINEMVNGELEKNAIRAPNPINVSFDPEHNKDTVSHNDCWKQLTMYDAVEHQEMLDRTKRLDKSQFQKVLAFSRTLSTVVNIILRNPQLIVDK
jgi:hypothetical protein